jgi:hypothetical protein
METPRSSDEGLGRIQRCGTGIDQPIPDEIEMIHGPGCPVCVTPLEIIDKALEIASRPDVIPERHTADSFDGATLSLGDPEPEPVRWSRDGVSLMSARVDRVCA